MKKIIQILLSFIYISVLVACSTTADFSRQAQFSPKDIASNAFADATASIGLSGAAPRNEQDVNPDNNIQTQRIIHYDGSLKLLVASPRDSIEKIIEITNREKGYVESISANQIVLQIPASHFRTVFKELSMLGEVLDKSITASDITEAYQSTKLRLKIANTTRKRLIQLLEIAKGEEEKLSLLKQIQDVTAQIEYLQASFAALKTQKDYSRITLSFTPRTSLGNLSGPKNIAAFYWISQLSPFERTVALGGEPLSFSVPKGMVEIDTDQYWLSESGDKSVFWASKRTSELQANTKFWLDALSLSLKGKFKSLESIQLGRYKILRLTSYDNEPHIYYVGIRVDKTELKIIEIYFPSAAQEKEYKANIFASIRGGES